MHIRKLLDNDRRRVNQLHKVISNRNINLSSHRHLLLSVIRPSIEYGSEAWEGTKSQAGSLESIILDGTKQILGCSSKTCNEAVRGDIGLNTLQSCRVRAKLKWWYKLATLPDNRYLKQLFNHEWDKEGLNTKVKLDIYKWFGKSVKFKKYLHGVCDAGSRLLFKFISGTHDLNKELGRHRRTEGKTECSLCGKSVRMRVMCYVGVFGT